MRIVWYRRQPRRCWEAGAGAGTGYGSFSPAPTTTVQWEVMQCTTSLGLSNVLGAHILVQELALSSWSWSICSMEGLPGIFLGPWNHLLQGGPPGLRGCCVEDVLGPSDSLSVMERMVLSARPVFLLLCYAFKGWSLVLLASSLARCFRCPGILYILCSHIVCAFRPILGCRYPKCFVWNDILYISLHILAFSCMFLHVLSDSSDSEFPFSTSQFMK